MTITGFQPLTLIDYPGVIASVVFTQGCPFRCVYCHNPELIPIQPSSDGAGKIDPEEVFAHLQKRRSMIEGVCVTGGEPTIHHDLPEFLSKLKRLGTLIKLDTNGIHPRMVEDLLRRRLVDYIAMDIKHVWDRYTDIIGSVAQTVVDQCRKTVALIETSGIPHEFRTTLYAGSHTEEDVYTMAGYFAPRTTYILQTVRYGKTLNPSLSQHPSLDLEALQSEIRVRYPTLDIHTRT